MTNNLSLARVSVSSMDNNCYLLCAGNEGLLIDAADNATALLNLAAENGVTITAVLTTHRHSDHTRALGEVLEATGAMHYAPAPDADALPAAVDTQLHDGDVLPFAGMELPVRILHGHTPGGAMVAATIDGVTHLFVGDSLFPGGVGKTNTPEQFNQLMDDVETKIFQVFSDDTIVHPGHGKDTTVGAERPELAAWRARGW